MSGSARASHGPADDALPSRYVVGIDLGTTNCAVGFVDTAGDAEQWRVGTFLIPQWVDWGQVERRATLPSFHFEPAAATGAALVGGLPWCAGSEAQPFAVGVLARDAGMQSPGRRIASAKSWLSHDGVDRSAALLPWHGDADVKRLSPVEVSARYLAHIRSAWNQAHPDEPLERQDVVITLPASFDEVARELTVEAARAAGLPRVYLIEEPQAAFYAWIDRHREDWHGRVGPGQMILVCDIGGGTTDFTLIRVRRAGDQAGEESQVQFHRVAVGKHLILGGDNLDLALARYVETKLLAAEAGAEKNAGYSAFDEPRLPPRDWDRLTQACRSAKETMLGDGRPGEMTVTLPSDGRRLIGGARSVTITAEEVDRVLVEGFFPAVEETARPESGRSGFREFGLPYAEDAAVTRHLAEFLATHAESGLEAGDTTASRRPELVLFNGGVMSSSRLRERIVDSIADWFGDREGWQPEALEADRLDLAVAHGAAYFGMVRRGRGVRIAANLGRSYFIQVADSPPETMCLIPGSAQPGQRFSPPATLQLHLGEPVQFPLWVSSTRLADAPGELVAVDPAELSPLPPIRTVLVRGKRKSADTIEVRMEAELSEIGTLGLYCVEAVGGRRWQLEFDIRSTLHTDREAHGGRGEALGIVDSELLAACDEVVRDAFAPGGKESGSIVKRLKGATGMDRSRWPPSLLRGIWQSLMDVAEGRRKSPVHEARWLNLVGYCLRPGYGMAVDDWRVNEVWRQVHGKLAFAAASSRTESLILWRRIAGGLSAGRQEQLVAPLLGTLTDKSRRPDAHEAAELWRMVASLEWLDAETKARLAEAAAGLLGSKRAAAYHAALLWAIGRLAARRPVYGPINTVISPETAEQLIPVLTAETSDAGARQLALMQIAEPTGDRYRDVSDAARRRALRWLESTQASPNRLDRVRGVGELTGEDDAAIFGESLPLGIRLVRS